MIKVLDLEPGDLFKITSVPNGDAEVYEYIGIEEREDHTIQRCRIRSVAFLMDGIWHTRKEQTEHNCNPYAKAQVVRMDFVSK
jgi:hypothetical protein